MAISIYSNSGIKNYGIKHFVLDTENDLNQLSTIYTPGTTAFIVETSQTYMLNNKKEWIQIETDNFTF